MAATKTQLEQRHGKAIVDGIFKFFRDFSKPNSKLDNNKLNHYFAEDIAFIHNNKTVARNIHQLEKRIKKIHEKFPTATYSKFHEGPIVAGNKIIVSYTAELVDANNHKRQINVMAILTVEDEHVTHWCEVTHREGTETFEA